MLDRTQTVSKGRRIVMLRATPDTQHALREWAIAQGFDLAWSHSGWPQTNWDFDFHVTLLATENAVSIPEGARWIEPVTVEASGFDVFGVDDRVPVLRLADHQTLTAMREFFITSYGAKPTFADFKPHVSLSYKWPGEPAVDSLAPPPFPLVFDFLVVGLFAPKAKVKDGAMPDFRTVVMLDKAEISGTRITRDGYMVADVRAARSGIQQYAGHEVGRPDLETVNVYRPEEEVFNKDSLASYAFKPVTINHPTSAVTADNWKQLSVGNVGGEVARDGGFVRVPLVLMDAQAIEAVKSGVREISMGYDVRLEFADGVTPNGQKYQAIQRDIRINHAALVERGRAGPACRIGDKGTPDAKSEREPATIGDQTMTTRNITVDGITIAVTDQGAQAIEKLQKQLGDSTKLLADANAALDTLKADKAKLVEDHAKALKDVEAKIPTADQMEAMLDKRSALIDQAKTLAPSLADSFKGKSAAEVRKAVVTSKLGDDAVKGKDDAFISAQFDTLVLIGGATDGADQIRDALKGGIVATNDADRLRDETLKKQREAWAS
ncbi:DUF2213 domain-containing protein [Hyphomicrobium sp. CS1GBMeth3]|uniref:DUF2213 domain-containing protein n=1 Tax=Hyphomicrobium sp. CS1GBMeth3 TaxID=1892845 RepID=UPI000931C4EC|nr:DUF2213 domain-containing protein [Hyphomicrobium sp. CS1GBMeth3]